MVLFHDGVGRVHPCRLDQIVDVRYPDEEEYGPAIRAVIVTEGGRFGVRESVEEAAALIEAAEKK